MKYDSGNKNKQTKKNKKIFSNEIKIGEALFISGGKSVKDILIEIRNDKTKSFGDNKEYEKYIIDKYIKTNFKLLNNDWIDFVDSQDQNKYSIKEYKDKNYKKGGKRIVSGKINRELPDGHFYEPLGSQSAPDICIIENGFCYPLEFKSTTSGNITWNSGLPDKNYIYIFNRNGEVIQFHGEDLMSRYPEDYFNRLRDFRDKTDERVDKFNSESRTRALEGGYEPFLIYYNRPMHVEESGFWNDERMIEGFYKKLMSRF